MDAGIADQNVAPALLAHDACHAVIDLRFAGDVHGKAERPAGA